MDSVFALPVLLVVCVASTAIAVYSYIYVQKIKKSYRAEIDLLRKKNSILSTGNDILKSMNVENKSRIVDCQVKRAMIQKELDATKDKLVETQKKLLSFSKMLKDMKES